MQSSLLNDLCTDNIQNHLLFFTFFYFYKFCESFYCDTFYVIVFGREQFIIILMIVKKCTMNHYSFN